MHYVCFRGHSFLCRYHRKKERQRGELEVGEDGDDGEELLSEYSPSELSAILAAEDAQREGGEQSETSSEGGDSDFSEEDDERAETKEEMLKRQVYQFSFLILVLGCTVYCYRHVIGCVPFVPLFLIRYVSSLGKWTKKTFTAKSSCEGMESTFPFQAI